MDDYGKTIQTYRKRTPADLSTSCDGADIGVKVGAVRELLGDDVTQMVEQ